MFSGIVIFLIVNCSVISTNFYLRWPLAVKIDLKKYINMHIFWINEQFATKKYANKPITRLFLHACTGNMQSIFKKIVCQRSFYSQKNLVRHFTSLQKCIQIADYFCYQMQKKVSKNVEIVRQLPAKRNIFSFHFISFHLFKQKNILKLKAL
jgi:hypothetical protein